MSIVLRCLSMGGDCGKASCHVTGFRNPCVTIELRAIAGCGLVDICLLLRNLGSRKFSG